MSVAFEMTAVRLNKDGTTSRLDGPDAIFRGYSSALFEFVSAIQDRRHSWRSGDPDFVWYFGAHDGSLSASRRESCFDPMQVLGSLQTIERELSRNRRRYGAGWRFLIANQNGESIRVNSSSILYRGARCRLVADTTGVWARETDPGPREGIHHELSKDTQVVVQQHEGGEALILTPKRHSLYEEHAESLARMKKVCLRAAQEKAHVLTETFA
jgi:hypothetical protein